MQFKPPVLKIMWLRRNTRVMDSFSSQKWKFTSVLCDQVTQYFGSNNQPC